MEHYYQAELAGHHLLYKLHYPSTYLYLKGFTRAEVIAAGRNIISSPEEWTEWCRTQLPPDSKNGYVESRAMVWRSSLALLEWDCCVFHAVALRWRGRAFLLTAPSGTGKTTQFRNWQRLFPGEVEMICGDMPVLEPRIDGSIWVHPSPWNGKESLRGAPASPAAGLVLLEQGPENQILPMSGSEAVVRCLLQLMVRPETEDQIMAISRLLNRLLSSLPLRRMVNRGDDASTAMLREELARMATEKEE